MEPMKGHESSDDDRPVRPGFKAPIPLDTRASESAKPNRPSLSEQLSGSSKESTPDRPKAIEEGLLFERPAAEDKLKPTPEPQSVTPETPAQEPAEKINDIKPEPNQQDFDREVERQVVAEVAAEQADTVLPGNNPDAVAAQQEMLDNIREEVSQAQPDTSGEAIIDQSFEQTMAEHADPEIGAATNQETDSAQGLEPELEPLAAARQATEAAYAEQAPTQPVSNGFEVPPITQPSFEGAVPVPPVQVGQGRPAEAQTYGSSSAWMDRLQGRQEGRQTANREYQSQTRSKDSLISKFKKLISQRQRQINEQVAARPVQAEAANAALPNRREPMTMPLPPEVAPVPVATANLAPSNTPEQPMPVNLSPFGAERPAAASAPLAYRPEQFVSTEAINRPLTTSEQIPTAELIKVAERIYVDGITVRSMFEVGRFDEDSLRRIVDGYLQGRNTAQIVNEEVQRHDRERFNRFETLNQVPRAGAAAQYGPFQQPSQPQPIVHGSLPQPVVPYGSAPNQSGGVDPNQRRPTAAETNSSVAERIVLGVSIFFIVVAAVILIGLFTRG